MASAGLAQIGRWLGRWLGVVLVLCTGLPFGEGSVRAQESALGSSYITPFPENDVYKLQVYGDSLAEGLLGGLEETFGGDNRLQIQRSRHAFRGVLRNEFEDELRSIEVNLSRAPVHIAVVIAGLYDRYSWRPQGGRRASVGSEEWKAEYGRRVDRLMKLLRTNGAALYWVGLPIMRRSDVSDDAQMINEIVRERAYVNSQKFIDVFSQFADENGAYSAYGPELQGKIRLLREADGMHFTQVGSRKLAHFVEREIRRDLNQARSLRSIPLAGTETEQKRIRHVAAPASPANGEKSAAAPAGGAKKKRPAVPRAPAAPRGPGASADGDVRADNSRVTLKSAGAGGKEESVVIDLPRPAIPASVMAVVTRRESPNRASQVGDSITAEIDGALMVISSLALSGSNVTGGRRALPPTQTPYYRVLVKGERLTPLPGRADDFSWPRPEPPAVEAFSAANARPASGVILAPAKSRRAGTPNG